VSTLNVFHDDDDDDDGGGGGGGGGDDDDVWGHIDNTEELEYLNACMTCHLCVNGSLS
jgi:hypothetical protein